MDDQVRLAFDALPKTRHWRSDAQFRHPEATPGRIMAAISEPTLIVHQSNGRTGYYRFEPDDETWFRVVLDGNGALRTAFRDDHLKLIREHP